MSDAIQRRQYMLHTSTSRSKVAGIVGKAYQNGMHEVLRRGDAAITPHARGKKQLLV